MKKKVRTGIAKAASVFRNLEKIWKLKILSTRTKVRIFNSNVISTLTYACESWKSTKMIENKLNAF
jgi:hypothetical protein